MRALAAPRRRGPVIGPAARPALLERLRGHAAHSPSALESWAACPVAWYVDRALRLEPLEPEDVPRRRGTLAHEALRAVFAAVRERTGSGRLDRASLPVALEALEQALDRDPRRLSPSQVVERAEQLRLRSDLRRYLEFAAESPSSFEPRELELAFGMPGDALAPVELDGLALCGRVDRVDIDGGAGTAIVIDYKTGASADPVARWAGRGRLQPALYMLAVERLFAVDAVAGLYQPLRAGDLRPRGVARDDVDAGVELVDNDRRDAGELRELLEQRLAVARSAARELASGAIAPRPQTCSPSGRCRHPVICRCEGR
jgi:RecB family exonuclease